MFAHPCHHASRARVLCLIAVAASFLPAALARGEIQWLSQNRSVTYTFEQGPGLQGPDYSDIKEYSRTEQTQSAPDFLRFNGKADQVVQTSSFSAFGGGEPDLPGGPYAVYLSIHGANESWQNLGNTYWTRGSTSAAFDVTFRLTEQTTFDDYWSSICGPLGFNGMRLSTLDGTLLYDSVPHTVTLDPGEYKLALGPQFHGDIGLTLTATAVPEPATLLFALAAPLLLRRTRSRQ